MEAKIEARLLGKVGSFAKLERTRKLRNDWEGQGWKNVLHGRTDGKYIEGRGR